MPHRGRGRGGNRTPDTPAQFSGEGAAAARTDGQPSGDNAPRPPQTPVSRQGNREGQTPQVGPGQGQQGPGPPAQIQDPFSQPSNRPNEDPTAPLPDQPASGPGAGNPADFADLTNQIDMATVAPALPVLEALSQQPGSSATLRNVVRRLRSQVPADFDLSDAFTSVQAVLAEDPSAAASVATPRGEESPNG